MYYVWCLLEKNSNVLLDNTCIKLPTLSSTQLFSSSFISLMTNSYLCPHCSRCDGTLTWSSTFSRTDLWHIHMCSMPDTWSVIDICTDSRPSTTSADFDTDQRSSTRLGYNVVHLTLSKWADIAAQTQLCLHRVREKKRPLAFLL